MKPIAPVVRWSGSAEMGHLSSPVRVGQRMAGPSRRVLRDRTGGPEVGGGTNELEFVVFYGGWVVE